MLHLYEAILVPRPTHAVWEWDYVHSMERIKSLYCSASESRVHYDLLMDIPKTKNCEYKSWNWKHCVAKIMNSLWRVEGVLLFRATSSSLVPRPKEGVWPHNSKPLGLWVLKPHGFRCKYLCWKTISFWLKITWAVWLPSKLAFILSSTFQWTPLNMFGF